jgi:hypothetical protein
LNYQHVHKLELLRFRALTKKRGMTARGEAMTKCNIRILLLGMVLATVATAAVAQSPYGYGPYNYNLGYGDDPPTYAYGPFENGENRNTAFGAGGTAGTHPTGAEVGPGRASMIHAN